MSRFLPSATGPRVVARGLDLASLAVTALEGGESPAAPDVPGYRVDSFLGAGALGRVWKAVRQADQLTVALKVAHDAHPAMVERLRSEAESLRALNHPGIVQCLGWGTLADDRPWLALEFVDGAPLAKLIPQRGFAWKEAVAYFRAIATAVAHAHRHGVLHRDLKPSNVLIGHHGEVKVADFGLARPIEERVVSFSLTLSGHVAGTAEYLAPECYVAGYQPAMAADIYALGVILHELLTGHPPRGAWKPVSQQGRVDIRVDEVLHRALDPDPGQRFASVEAMLEEIDRIDRSPPRYAGTPRVTRPVRFLDAAWTVLGLFIFLGAFGLVVRIEKYGIGLPVDLIGTEPIRIGTYQAVFILLMLGIPLGAWQLFRLWRFRAVPLREALPSPFGLRLGASRLAAVAVALAQVVCVLAPGLLGVMAWQQTCTHWLTEHSAPWEQGLVVTVGYRGKVAHDPWKWGEPGKKYSLRERMGWINDPLSTQIDHTQFYPGMIPRVMAVSAGFYAATVLITLLSALARWWRFRKWGHALALAGVLGLTSQAVEGLLVAEQDESRPHAEPIPRDGSYWYDHVKFAEDTGKRLTHPALVVDGPFPDQETLARFGDQVRLGEGPAVGRDALAPALAAYAAEYWRPGRTLIHFMHRSSPSPDLSRFGSMLMYEDCEDLPGQPGTGALTAIGLYGSVVWEKGVAIDQVRHLTVPLWSAERRTLSADEAERWARALLDGLAVPTPSGQPDPLAPLLLPRLISAVPPCEWMPDLVITPRTREETLQELRSVCERGARPRLARAPDRFESLPGARWRCTLPIQDRGQPAEWHVDLVFADGRWQAARLVF
jgi:hypothetical protein